MNVLERMEAIGAQERIDHFNELQKLPFNEFGWAKVLDYIGVEY